MTPEEAIQVLEVTERDKEIQFWTASREAIKLGIEALRFRQRWEEQEGEEDFPLMPGETKE